MLLEWCNSILDLFASDAAPAWVQAIGSILAVIIAMLAPRISAKHAGLIKQKNILSVVTASHSYACDIRSAIDSIDGVHGSNLGLYDVYHKDVLAGVIRALESIPVGELASAEETLAVLGLTSQMVFLGAAVEKMLFAPSQLPDVQEVLKGLEEDRAARRELLDSVPLVLKANAKRHLNLIDKHYAVLKKTLGG